MQVFESWTEVSKALGKTEKVESDLLDGAFLVRGLGLEEEDRIEAECYQTDKDGQVLLDDAGNPKVDQAKKWKLMAADCSVKPKLTREQVGQLPLTVIFLMAAGVLKRSGRPGLANILTRQASEADTEGGTPDASPATSDGEARRSSFPEGDASSEEVS